MLYCLHREYRYLAKGTGGGYVTANFEITKLLILSFLLNNKRAAFVSLDLSKGVGY